MGNTTILLKTQGLYDVGDNGFNFRDDTVGSAPAGWVSVGPIIIDSLAGHKRVLEFEHEEFSTVGYGSDQATGTIECYVYSTDVATGASYIQVGTSAGSYKFIFGIENSKWSYFDGAWFVMGGLDGVYDPVNNTWYHVSLAFDCGPDTFVATIDEIYVSDAEPFDFLATGLSKIQPYSNNEGSFYMDAVAWSWDPSYSVGDNLTLEIQSDITSSTKRFIIDHPIKRTPTARGIIFNQPLDYDDIIIVTGNRTSYLNSKIGQNGEIYKGTYNFRDDILGGVPTDWSDNSGASCDTYLIDKYNEHCRVIQLEDYSGANRAEITNSFTETATGTVELYVCCPTTILNNRCDMIIGDGGETNSAQIAFNGDTAGKIQYYDGAWNNIMDFNGGQWYHFRIEFDCANDWHLWIDEVSKDGGGGYAFRGNPTAMDQTVFITNSGDTDYIFFVDSIGYSWDTDYTVGDNLELEVTLTDQTLFEGRVIEEATEYEKDIKLDSLSVEGEEIHPGEEGTPYNPDGYSGIISNFTEEVIAETINVNCSIITATLTDEYYRGNYSLENDSNATTPMGVIDDSAGAGTLEVLTASLGSHKNYIHIDHADADHGIFKMVFEAQTSGVIEWYVRTSNVATGLTEMFFYDSGGVVKIKLTIQGSKHKWYDGVALTVGSAAAVNIWYQYRLSFDCDTDTFSLWIDGNLEANGADFFAVSADIGQLRFEAAHDIGNPSFDSYFDAFGFSWDKFYSAASDPTDLSTYQNSHIYIYGIEAGGGTVDFSLQGEHSIERLASTASDLDVNIWKYSPDHKWLYDSGTLDNQITLTKYCKDVTGTDFLERFNTIITKGGWNAGSRVYGGDSDGDAQTTYGIKTISRFYTAIDEGSTPLNTIAASILSLQGNTPKIVTLVFRNTTYGMFAVGETITVPASTIQHRANTTYLDAGAWLISSISYDCIRDVNIMRLVNTLFFEYNFSLIEELETLANG